MTLWFERQLQARYLVLILLFPTYLSQAFEWCFSTCNTAVSRRKCLAFLMQSTCLGTQGKFLNTQRRENHCALYIVRRSGRCYIHSSRPVAEPSCQEHRPSCTFVSHMCCVCGIKQSDNGNISCSQDGLSMRWAVGMLVPEVIIEGRRGLLI